MLKRFTPKKITHDDSNRLWRSKDLSKDSLSKCGSSPVTGSGRVWRGGIYWRRLSIADCQTHFGVRKCYLAANLKENSKKSLKSTSLPLIRHTEACKGYGRFSDHSGWRSHWQKIWQSSEPIIHVLNKHCLFKFSERHRVACLSVAHHISKQLSRLAHIMWYQAQYC